LLQQSNKPPDAPTSGQKVELLEKSIFDIDRESDVSTSSLTTQESGALESITAELSRFGLNRSEIRVYLHLARTGPARASQISSSLSIPRTEVYHILNSLQERGMVKVTFERPVRFVAEDFMPCYDNLVEAEREKILEAEKRRHHLSEVWDSLAKGIAEDAPKETFQVLTGANRVYSKLRSLITHARAELFVSCSKEDLVRFYHLDLIDENSLRNKPTVKIVSEFQNNLSELIGLGKDQVKDRDGESLPCFLIIDSTDLVFFVRHTGVRKDDVCAIWSNYPAMVGATKLLFNMLWETPTSSVIKNPQSHGLQNAKPAASIQQGSTTTTTGSSSPSSPMVTRKHN
jgi:sugar-specific transcriptional regulator TrmB